MIKKKINEIFKNKYLINIIDLIEGNGGEVKLVGGIVRDIIIKNNFKGISDIDLVTNLRPNKILKILARNNVNSFILNDHYGTVTTNFLKIKYEITTLRTDIKSFGRHSKVRYHSDWNLDAQRRDFTINAIYLDKYGQFFDPFNGIEDLKNGRINFIGDPNLRIKEDHLRIFRFIRFFSIYSKNSPYDDMVNLIRLNIKKINFLSTQRVSEELKIIFSLPYRKFLKALNIITKIDLDREFFGHKIRLGKIKKFNIIINKVNFTSDLLWIIRLVILSDFNVKLVKKLSLSKKEINFFNEINIFLTDEEFNILNTEDWKTEVYNKGNAIFLKYIIYSLNKDQFNYTRVKEIKNFKNPVFPIKGKDLLKLGFKTGEEIGKNLLLLENYWVKKSFAVNKENLIKKIKLIYKKNGH